LAVLKLWAGVDHYYAEIDSFLLLLLKQVVENHAVTDHHKGLWFVFIFAEQVYAKFDHQILS
jgi:hypothetical protein